MNTMLRRIFAGILLASMATAMSCGNTSTTQNAGDTTAADAAETTASGPLKPEDYNR